MKRFLTSLKEADIRNILAIVIVLASFALQTIICFKPIPTGNHDIVITTIVMTLGLQGLVGGYFYGASRVDRRKPVENEKPET